MGKVKLRIVGDESAEQEQKNDQKKKNEAKKQAKGLNMGGGQRINTVGVSEEEIMTEGSNEPKTEASEKSSEAGSGSARKSKKRHVEVRTLSKRHTSNETHVAKNTIYPVKNGLEILRKFTTGKFDETVELHINVKEKGVAGVVSLPHGTGKKLNIRLADDALITEVEKGKIDFDILVATPDMMPKLAKVARVLGPRGLMPNPKAGTVTTNPDALIEKLSAGQVNYKTEAAAPLIHMSVGKLSFKDDQLSENIKTALSSIGTAKINSVTLKSTMSPAIRLQV